MKYVNARSVLPEPMLEKLQEYAEGKVLYIPKRPQNRKGWGEVRGSKEITKVRNAAIRAAFSQGASFRALAEQYCLTEETIKKIVYQKP